MDADVPDTLPIIPVDALGVQIQRPSNPAHRTLWREAEEAWGQAHGRPPLTLREWNEVTEAYNRRYMAALR